MKLIQEISATSPYGIETERYFRNIETGEEYSRVPGVVSFPSGNKSGVCMVGSESRERDPKLHKTLYRILNFYESTNVSDLMDKCEEFKVIYCADPWYGDDSDPIIEAIRKSHPSFYLQTAPHAGDLRYFVVLIQNLTSIGKKRLYLNNPNLTARLWEIPSEKVLHGQVRKFPLLAAVGMLLASMEQYKYDPKEESELWAYYDELAEVEDD